MKFFRLFCCLLFCHVIGLAGVVAEPVAADEIKILCLGDSLTAGLGVNLEDSYPAQLERRLRQLGYDIRVINSGVSGETSRGTLSRLDWILAQKPDIVILEIGANDGLRGIDVAFMEKNLRQILARLHESGAVVVFAGMQMVWNMGQEYTGNFNEVYPKIARELGVIFMPFFLEGVATVPELNNSDGIHPNAKGYEKITANLLPYVTLAIAQLD